MASCRVLLAAFAFVATVAVGVSADCQPCDSIYDRCLPACNGMSSCQTRCMQSHFDCRMQVPGCFKVTVEAEAPVAVVNPTPAGCYTSCAATFSQCTQACKPGDVACFTQCTSTYQQSCLPKCGMPAPPSVGLTPCAAACKLTADAAKALCKLKRKDKREHCEWQVAQALDVCNTACDLKVEAPPVESVGRQPSAACAQTCYAGYFSCYSKSGDVQQCTALQQLCLNACPDVTPTPTPISIPRTPTPVSVGPLPSCVAACAAAEGTCNGATGNGYSCAAQYQQCLAQCPWNPAKVVTEEAEATEVAIDTKCLYSCLQDRAQCTDTGDQCNSQYEVCEGTCGLRVESSFAPPSRPTVSECRKQCKTSAQAKCDKETGARRAMCLAEKSQTVIKCQAACAHLKPNGLEVEAEAVTGARECIKECKSEGKDAAQKCKHEKLAKRAQCFAQVPTTVKACESGCIRKPHGESLSESSTPVRPLLGDCQPCDAIYDQCLPACNGMSNCQLKCMQTHFDCRMATPGC